MSTGLERGQQPPVEVSEDDLAALIDDRALARATII